MVATGQVFLHHSQSGRNSQYSGRLPLIGVLRLVVIVRERTILLARDDKGPLDVPPPPPLPFIKFALRSRPWISCRVAEGRALRSHDNRIRIHFLVARCQLSPYTGGT